MGSLTRAGMDQTFGRRCLRTTIMGATDSLSSDWSTSHRMAPSIRTIKISIRQSQGRAL